MTPHNSQVQKWVLLGFGEVAATLFAPTLRGATGVECSVCLPLGRQPSEATLRRLRASGLVATYEASGVNNAAVVVSAVTPAAAVRVAESVAPYLGADCIYVDVNSVAGPTVAQIAGVIESQGGRFVDAAIMGPVPLLRDQVPIFLSGRAAANFHKLASALGLNTTVVSSQPGDASSAKMVWSVMTKGTIALLAETLIAAHRLGLLDPLRQLLAQEYGQAGTDAMILRMLRSTTLSGARRLNEMDEVKKTLDAVSVPAWTVGATRRWISELSRLTAARTSQSVEEVVRAISEELEPVKSQRRVSEVKGDQ